MQRTSAYADRLACPVLAVLVLGLLLVGCGSGRGDGSLSKREYIARSNAVQQEAASVFRSLDGRVATTPAEAARYLATLDRLDAGLSALDPPETWQDEHEVMLESVRTMRQAMAIVSRASPRNRRVIELQLERSMEAQRAYEQAVRAINASR